MLSLSTVAKAYCLGGLLVAVTGCQRFQQACQDALPTLFVPTIEVPVSNPSRVGPHDPEFLWLQVVDAVDDHFRIQSEQWVRRDQDGWLEGRLTTYPEVSGTSLEPWRREASRGIERLQSTIQTIRRTATVRVIPEESGYVIDVTVLKEQEDVDQAQASTAGSSAQRHDGTIVRNENQQRQLPVTLGWFEIGRDADLEQRIMAGILGRISNVQPPKHGLLGRH
ncbi:MAG: hypothetical protein KF752_12280 [Pirellulaceae bacterium]|nr:hypothetical protein [Pirellulaceae bacterium]